MATPLMAEIRRTSGFRYRATADYASSLRTMLRSVRFRAIDQRVTEEHFPVSPLLGEILFSAVLFRPLRKMKSSEIFPAIRREGQALDLPKLIALIRENEERLDAEYPMAAMGSLWDTGTEFLVPVVTEEAGGLNLELRPLSAGFDEYWNIPVES